MISNGYLVKLWPTYEHIDHRPNAQGKQPTTHHTHTHTHTPRHIPQGQGQYYLCILPHKPSLVAKYNQFETVAIEGGVERGQLADKKRICISFTRIRVSLPGLRAQKQLEQHEHKIK